MSHSSPSDDRLQQRLADAWRQLDREASNSAIEAQLDAAIVEPLTEAEVSRMLAKTASMMASQAAGRGCETFVEHVFNVLENRPIGHDGIVPHERASTLNGVRVTIVRASRPLQARGMMLVLASCAAVLIAAGVGIAMMSRHGANSDLTGTQHSRANRVTTVGAESVRPATVRAALTKVA